MNRCVTDYGLRIVFDYFFVRFSRKHTVSDGDNNPLAQLPSKSCDIFIAVVAQESYGHAAFTTSPLSTWDRRQQMPGAHMLLK